MTRDEYRLKLTEELSGMGALELRDYARAHYVKLYTRVPDRMREAIVSVMTTREFHGDAFREQSIQTPVQGM